MSNKIVDIDEFLYSCGLEILHPGGLKKTDEMARMCRVSKDKLVLDIGCGKGVSACYLAEKYDCMVIGIDVSERMIQYAKELARRKGLEERVSFRVADAHNLPFEDEKFDIVIAECTTVLLNKNRAFQEFIRVLKPGGYIGDLEMIWRRRPPEELVRKTREIWNGFETMTLSEWEEFFRKQGLIEIKAVDFSDELSNMEKAFIKELGLKGLIIMLCRLLLRPDIRKAMKEYWNIFKNTRTI